MFREVPPTSGMPLRWKDFCLSRKSSLEWALGQYLDLPQVQIECSGTASFLIALEYLKRKSSRKEVIIPAYTCPLIPIAIAQAGLKVRLCDTYPDDFNMDDQLLRKLCNENTLCVVPTHLGGLVADLKNVLEISRSCGAYVIEDAAQALGATWDGTKAGTVGDIGFFSLTRGKGLTMYEGGVLVARDQEIRSGLLRVSKELSQNNYFLELVRLVQVIGYKLAYNPLALTFFYGWPLRYWLKLGKLTKAVGDDFSLHVGMHKVSKLRKDIVLSAFSMLPQMLYDNIKRARYRVQELEKITGLKVMKEQPQTSGTWPFLCVLLPSERERDRALSILWGKGIGVTRLFINDLSAYTYLRKVVPLTTMANARLLAARLLTISNSHWLSEGDFQQVCTVLGSSLERS